MSPFSLYVHIPYCDSKCPYCDFNSYAVKRWPEEEYAAALIAEMEHYTPLEPWRDRSIETIFLGGGTPSLFAAESIARLLEAADRLWPVRTRTAREITLEANPGTVDLDKLEGFRGAGVNRISFGVQSFTARHLGRLGRIHDAEQAKEAIRMARAAGFDNLNLDLIFAVPGQTLEEWESDLGVAIDLGPDHISAYNLTFEEGTPFEAMRRKGEIGPLPEEIEVAMFTRTREVLTAAGYPPYEISNFAHPGRECRHNLNYWQSGEYLGVGAGAHSFAIGRRWSNEKGPVAYLTKIAANGEARVFEESVTEAQARGEFVFLALRLMAGFEERRFQERFGLDLLSAFPRAGALLGDQLLEHEVGSWRLSPRGLLIADSIFATFVP